MSNRWNFRNPPATHMPPIDETPMTRIAGGVPSNILPNSNRNPYFNPYSYYNTFNNPYQIQFQNRNSQFQQPRLRVNLPQQPTILHSHKIAHDHDGLGTHQHTVPSHSDRHTAVPHVDVLHVNTDYGGTHDPQVPWQVDCNPGGNYYHHYVVGLWDDRDNFEDLDKVKCASANGVSLDLFGSVIVDLGDGKSMCPDGFIITAIWDEQVGFQHPKKIKCSKVQYPDLDLGRQVSIYTNGRSGGSALDYDYWNVQCAESSASIGIEMKDSQILAFICVQFIEPR